MAHYGKKSEKSEFADVIKFRIFDFYICPWFKYTAENFIHDILSCS